MTTHDIYKAIQELKFTEIQAYFRGTGWNRIDLKRGNISLFQKEIGASFFEAVVPLDKNLGDYEDRVYDALKAISKAENRSIDQVLTDLSLPPSDVVRFRVSGKDTLGGTISFLDGFSLLENAKKVLFATACDILQPEKYHKRLGLKGAQQFIEECRLGQTEKGSFIASVICPFVNRTDDDRAQQLNLFNDEKELQASFTREVTHRMMESLEFIKSSIDGGEEGRIIDMDGPSTISANFLESILDLNSSRENSEIEIITSWSVFASSKYQAPKSIIFSNDYIPVFETVINKIKPKDEGITDIFIGRISQTKADPDPHTRTEGEVTLNYILGDEEKVSKAKIFLDKENYDKACLAHKDGLTVRVKGTLVQSGRIKTIQSPDFQIVN